MEQRPHRTPRRQPRRDGTEQAEALGRHPLFAGCSPAELRRIDSLTYELDVPAGRVLAKEGELAAQVLFVTAGWGRATRGCATVGSYEPGSCIGGPEVAAHAPFAATITAETTVTVLAASPREFRSLLDIPAVARLAVAPTTGFEPAPAEPEPAADADPTWAPAGWLAYAEAAGDQPWPPYSAAPDGARMFETVARYEAGGLGS